jgi:HK97 family phage prohead protease
VTGEPRTPLYFHDEDRWKKYVHAGNEAASTEIKLFRQLVGVEKSAINAEQRSAVFTISTEARDRMGDRIMVEGWKLKTYRKNPVVLWAHNKDPGADMLPIGRTVSVLRDVGGDGQKRLRATKQFTTRDENPFGAMVFDLIKGGYLNTASVGFRPLRADPDKALSDEERELFPYATLFRTQELLESSVVPIPANPEAIIEAKGVIDVSPYKSFAERILDGDLDPALLEPAFGTQAEDVVERVYSIVTDGGRFKSGGTIVISPDDTPIEPVVSAETLIPAAVIAQLEALATSVKEMREELRAFAPAPEPKAPTETNPEPDTDPVVNFKISPEDLIPAFLNGLRGKESNT